MIQEVMRNGKCTTVAYLRLRRRKERAGAIHSRLPMDGEHPSLGFILDKSLQLNSIHHLLLLRRTGGLLVSEKPLL